MFRRRQLSDTEYVEQVRKRDRTIRRMRWLWPLLLLAMLCCLLWLAELVQTIPDEKMLVYVGLLLGASFGFIFSIVAAHAALCVKQWIEARHGFRTERLMLKYYDELNNKESSGSQTQRR